MIRFLFCTLLALLLAPHAWAGGGWKIQAHGGADFALKGAIQVEGGLSDGWLVRATGPSDIAEAWYSDPTRRYGHAILGDAIEAAALKARVAAGGVVTFDLPSDEVFEDLAPRLADLDGDGTTEIITIRSSLHLGAAVTVYGLVDSELKQRASTGFIGLSNRWLNVAAIADLRGTGGLDIAYVETPHIGGTLFLYSLQGDKLMKRDSLYGFSNHRIGDRELRLSALADVDEDGRPELALPSADRGQLKIVDWDGQGLKVIADIDLPGRIDKAILTEGKGVDAAFIVGLTDGRQFRISR